ncbi:Crotonobetainyl-CoA reductase [Paraburkholderia nemoris]|uniref:acyl-CoA dehydrogenase n=1 Tax=Paraburkholderia nemoris TaxID=2793076 RepID=UPI00190D95DB|nr:MULTISPECIES: acyl-CoA dehydrogenase [Paraburkholderia]MBK3782075.1 acyl-CoA dehydrogenase [Paraburkholderia aspalathi]CAE6749222.1 Crotonobetainyl-CoA reductase [Paraburkholderia nemoris]
MDFVFNEDQEALASSVKRFLMTEMTPELIRELWNTPTGRSERMWDMFATQGLTAVSVPERHDGMGLGEVEWALLAQTYGYFAGPEPLLDTALVAVGLLDGLPASAQRDALLRDIAVVAARVAIAHPVNPYVSDAHVAKVLLCEREGELHWLTPDACRLNAVESIDPSRRLFELDWQATPGTRVATAAEAQPLLARALDQGAFAVAAQLLGLTQRVLDVAIDYSAQRKQFGKPIGSYQALKHLLADVAIRYEFARPVVYRAACAIADNDPNRALYVSHAKLAATAAAQLAARHAMQVHGAIGYTWELDLQIFMKRIWALSGSWGDITFHKARVADALIESCAPIGPARTFELESQ